MLPHILFGLAGLCSLAIAGIHFWQARVLGRVQKALRELQKDILEFREDLDSLPRDAHTRY